MTHSLAQQGSESLDATLSTTMSSPKSRRTKRWQSLRISSFVKSIFLPIFCTFAMPLYRQVLTSILPCCILVTLSIQPASSLEAASGTSPSPYPLLLDRIWKGGDKAISSNPPMSWCILFPGSQRCWENSDHYFECLEQLEVSISSFGRNFKN